jgi:hypothetical protein
MLDATRVPPGQRRAAVAGAPATVLAYLYPDAASVFDEVASGERPRAGLAEGRRIGARAVAETRTDGSDAVWTGPVPAGPGLWVPTPPAFAPPLEPLAGDWRPWNLSEGSHFRPSPPPTFGSKAYAREVQEVYDVSLSLTDEQKRIAEFWADGPGNITPAGHWNRIAIELIRSRGLSDVASARVFAALNTAQADAFIACWDAKFTLLVRAPRDGDSPGVRFRVAFVHHDPAVTVLRLRALDHVFRGLRGDRRVLPRIRAAASCLGAGGRRITPLRGHPLPL